MNRLSTACLRLIPLTLVVGLWACEPPSPEGMVRMAAGGFEMGTDEVDAEGKAEDYGLVVHWFDASHPAYRVDLAAYDLDRTEVTNQAYGAFVSATGHRPPPHWRGGTPVDGEANHPVTHVSWHDAQDYCRWNGAKRLPTEMEWERAARGRNGRIYPWGNTFQYAATNASRGHTSPVGSYPDGDTPAGIADLIGNVWEWTDSWYDAYPGSPYEDDRFGKTSRVLRGNSWASVGHYPDQSIFMDIVANNSRATYRLFLKPEGRLNDVGFRCAKSVK